MPLFTLALVCFAASSAIADSDIKIAVVDLEKALAKSRAGLTAQKGYQKEVEQARSRLDSKKNEFEKLQQDFSKQRDSLSSSALGEKQERLMTLEKDLKRNLQDSQETLRRRNATIVRDLMVKVEKVVQTIGKEKGYTLILEKKSQALMYADNSVDITSQVIQRFDAASE